MEVFSLEEEDCNQMFLTQESNKNSENCDEKVAEDSQLFLGVECGDFMSLVTSLRRNYSPLCSDISDNEFEDSSEIIR